MDTELKAKWTAALRSKQYKQGRFGMRPDASRFCCLGVLCDVCRMPTDNAEQIEAGYTVLRELGIDVDTFMRLNDSEGLTFSEIADYIDANL